MTRGWQEDCWSRVTRGEDGVRKGAEEESGRTRACVEEGTRGVGIRHQHRDATASSCRQPPDDAYNHPCVSMTHLVTITDPLFVPFCRLLLFTTDFHSYPRLFSLQAALLGFVLTMCGGIPSLCIIHGAGSYASQGALLSQHSCKLYVTTDGVVEANLS